MNIVDEILDEFEPLKELAEVAGLIDPVAAEPDPPVADQNDEAFAHEGDLYSPPGTDPSGSAAR